MADLISPGSAMIDRFRIEPATGRTYHAPQGGGGGYDPGVTTSRLRGAVLDKGTGALVIADLASVDVTRPPSGAMAGDAEAAFWLRPDSIQSSAGVITSWVDATGNGFDHDLGSRSTGSRPTFDVGSGRAIFALASQDGLRCEPATTPLRARINAGGTVAGFMILNLKRNIAPSTARAEKVWQLEADLTNGFWGRTLEITAFRNTFGDGYRDQHYGRGRASDGGPEWQGLSEVGDGFIDDELMLLSWTLSLDSYSHAFNGVTTISTATTGLPLSSAQSRSLQLLGDSDAEVAEVFVTLDGSPSHVAAITAELMTAYGLTA